MRRRAVVLKKQTYKLCQGPFEIFIGRVSFPRDTSPARHRNYPVPPYEWLENFRTEQSFHHAGARPLPDRQNGEYEYHNISTDHPHQGKRRKTAARCRPLRYYYRRLALVRPKQWHNTPKEQNQDARENMSLL